MNMFNNGQQNQMQNQLQMLKDDPAAAMKQRGWNVPPEIIGNPQAMVMHLIQTGQVGGPIIQQIMPMLRGMK